MEKVLEFGRKYKYLILSGLVILMMIIAGVMVYLFGDKKEEVVEDVIKEHPSKKNANIQTNVNTIFFIQFPLNYLSVPILIINLFL